ncbi:MAG: 3-hydroxyacyl-CoA dehydrogenase [Deltaproteobacteria bacterium]|nr:3-hydroxyacyl-CoA dehydrogenase [Deltaproteobacteria bacterium]
MEIASVGVVGGGVMGCGIAQALLASGYRVHLKEVDEPLLRKGLAGVASLFAASAKKAGLAGAEVERRLAALHGTTSYGDLEAADVVIEAVPEILSLKHQVLAELDRVCREDAVLASNTSSLYISELAAVTRRPGRVIGMHWFNPAHRMRLVEVVPGLETTEATVAACLDFARSLGKSPVVVKECAGFLVNRLLGLYVNEALRLLEEGSSPDEVDGAARGLGLPMGPLELGDLVGWDTIARANGTLSREYGSRFALPAVFEALVEGGFLGAKAGRGIRDYAGARAATPSAGRTADPSLAGRLLLCLLNEGIRCLDEGVASEAAIESALKLGAGLPRGPLEWADELGLDRVLGDLEVLRERLGERFLPSALLRRKVAARHLGKASGRGFLTY